MLDFKKQISIIGAGAMGTAIACLIGEHKKGKVRLWDRNPELITEIKRTRKNIKYLDPEIEIPKDVLFYTDLKAALEDSDLVLLAVPSFAIREVCQKISYFSLPPILMISKGLEKETSLLPFQIVKKVLGKNDTLHLTWVNFAKDIKEKILKTEILASEDENLLKEFKNLFETNWIKIETSTDLLGIQLAGALKNVMVIGIGLAESQKANLEIKVKFIQESVKEMIELGKAMGAREESFLGPAGKKNLEITADSRSRNYCLGKTIFEKGIDEVWRELEGVTIEGFNNTWAVYQLIKKYKLDLSIIEEIYRVIYERKDPKLSAKKLIRLIS